MKVPVPMIGGSSGAVSAGIVVAILLGIVVFAARNSNQIVAGKVN